MIIFCGVANLLTPIEVGALVCLGLWCIIGLSSYVEEILMNSDRGRILQQAFIF